MSVTLVTLTGDVGNLLGIDFVTQTPAHRRTTAWVESNAPLDRIVDTDTGKVRLGTARAKVNPNGTFSFVGLVATGSADTNLEDSENLQYTVHVKAPSNSDPNGMITHVFGPYSVAEDADLSELEPEQALTATYQSAFMTQVDAILAQMVSLSEIDTSDSLVAGLIENNLLGPLTRAALSDAFVARYGPGISPFHFGALGDGSDDAVPLQAFWDYVCANDVGTANISGDFVTSVGLVVDSPATKKFAGTFQITAEPGSTGAVLLTLDNCASTDWDTIVAEGTAGAVSNYAAKTWQVGVLCTGGTSRANFRRIQGGNFSAFLLAGYGGNSSANNYGVVKAHDCGSGVRNGSTFYGLNVTVSNPVNSGSSGSTAQSCVLDVDVLPPSWVLDGDYGAIDDAPYLIRIPDANNPTGYRLHYITAVNVGASKITVFPWVDPATTGVDCDYVWGGALYVHGADSNVSSAVLLDAMRCGIGLSQASLYAPKVGAIITQACGAGIMYGRVPNGAVLGGRMSPYCETNIEDIVMLSRPGGANVYGWIDSEYAVALDKCYNIGAPKVSTTFLESDSFRGFDGFSFGYRGKNMRWEKRPGTPASTQNITLDRPDMQLALYGNSFTINVTLDSQINRLMGYDTVQFVVANTSGGAPSGSVTFPAPSGYTINGGSSDVVFSGLLAATRFIYRFDVANANVIVFQVFAAIPSLFAYKPSDTTRNNTNTLADDPHLTLAVEANTVYEMEALLFGDATTTADMKFGFTGPSGATLHWASGSGAVNASSSGSALDQARKTLAQSAVWGGIGAASVWAARPQGTLIVGGTAGGFTMQWAQNTAEVSDAILREGSRLTLTPIA